jgi:hypothetical protein
LGQNRDEKSLPETPVHKRLTALTLTLVLVLQSSCGGGSGVFLFNAFVGFWINGCEPNGLGGSERVVIQLSELSESRLTGSFTVQTYDNPHCAGRPTGTVQLAVIQQGTQTLHAGTAIRVTIGGQSGENDLLFSDNGRLFRGDPASAGADGFPTAIDFSRPWTPG